MHDFLRHYALGSPGGTYVVPLHLLCCIDFFVFFVNDCILNISHYLKYLKYLILTCYEYSHFVSLSPFLSFFFRPLTFSLPPSFFVFITFSIPPASSSPSHPRHILFFFLTSHSFFLTTYYLLSFQGNNEVHERSYSYLSKEG